MMENGLAALYRKLIDRPGGVYTFAVILAAAGIAAPTTKAEHAVDDGVMALLLSGDLLFGLFVTMLIVLVIVGARIDDRPGKSIALALGVMAVGSIVRMLLPFSRSIGWLAEWNGAMLGIMIITLYLSLRIGARFAVAAMGCALYTMFVTAGITLSLADRITVPGILTLTSVGALAVVLAFLGYSLVRSRIESARRDPVSHSVRTGMVQAMPFLVLAGLAVLLFAAPLALVTDGPLRDFGLYLMVGGPMGACAALMSAIPLAAMTQNIRFEAAPPARRGGRRQR
ncbi:MAG: hypothetical protein F4Y38_10730 [Gemmatimonadetes bacterium]|nr:hypothetical protein [Gemmatimonadota bacterium]MXY49750.1 hypothetical protein [Gemmatimonadota bacterium]MYG86566.1 hypothetical protein [Gemmatimonadota bacterium]MYJ89566.1 hypothetical protein [Gemmatimonadota bacterium]